MSQVPDPSDQLEQNKAIVRRMLDAFNKKDREAVNELLHPELKDHSRALGVSPQARGEGAVQRVRAEVARDDKTQLRLVPDGVFTEESLVAEGDTVVLRWSMTGTHKGSIAGRKATGKRVKVRGMEIVKIKDGKIIEHDDDNAGWTLDLLRQIGELNDEVLSLPEFRR